MKVPVNIKLSPKRCISQRFNQINTESSSLHHYQILNYHLWLLNIFEAHQN